MREAVDLLQQAGIQAQGEVVDGGAREAIGGALALHRPDEITVVTYSDEPGAPDEEAVIAAARGVPVEYVRLDVEAPTAPAGGTE